MLREGVGGRGGVEGGGGGRGVLREGAGTEGGVEGGGGCRPTTWGRGWREGVEP